jgi:hypothetical protein
MTQDFPGVEIDVGGAGDYVPKVDAKIRRIKETYRKVKSGLAWELPRQLIGDLVTYCVSRLNIRRMTALAENVCPRVLFTGVPIDYRRELAYAFGDYVEAYKGTTNKSKARSAACIALFPTGNSIGSWVLWKIDTRSRVRRSNIEKLVTTERIINIINAVTAEEREQENGQRGTNAGDPAEDPVEIQAAPDAENQAESQGETSAKNLAESQAAIQEDVVESGEENPDEDASIDVTEG